MSGEVSEAIQSLPRLRIRTTAGLFSELVQQTNNRVPIHVRSEAVDWSISYDVPPLGFEVSFDELCARIPDLKIDYESAGGSPFYAAVNEISFSNAQGFRATLNGAIPEPLREFLLSNGYSGLATADAKTFSENTPLFIHAYIRKLFGKIPMLHLARPFGSRTCYSQLAITYKIAFILGMLVRYFPTQWISLSQGEKGDTWWPTISRAQHLVETTYPELIVELLHDILNEAKLGQGLTNDGTI